jgi:hypothetical protein
MLADVMTSGKKPARYPVPWLAANAGGLSTVPRISAQNWAICVQQPAKTGVDLGRTDSALGVACLAVPADDA